MKNKEEQNIHLALFKGKKIRRTIFNKEWYFSVVDVVETLTDSPAPRQYWGVVKSRESQLLTFCLQLKLESVDGKRYETDCANTEGMFRIIQSIPSPKAEPLKRWLAKVGYERMQEIENPELATKRTRLLYKLKVRIEKRVFALGILTNRARGAKVQHRINRCTPRSPWLEFLET